MYYLNLFIIIINSSRHINEDKRKTEKQMHMFEIIRDIEDVPVMSGCGLY